MKEVPRAGRRDLAGDGYMRGATTDPEGTELATLDRLVSLTGKRVLEVGCGSGRLTWSLAERARSVDAIDPDRLDIARARRELPGRLTKRVRFEVGRAESLPFHDEEFDAVVFSWSL
ncbi:MAG TPA: class I SAM-dependent methyltransferase [bacterium]|nr:class I SAM-dependent methyltransferase [bacterium]